MFYASRLTSHLSRFVQQIVRRPGLVALLLFLAALVPRLPGLGRFLTSDENTNIFFAGSDVIAAFLRGDLRGTYWHFYPGVTMSWLDAAGMAGQYLLDALTGTPVPPFTDYIYGDILSLLVANRLPYAVLTAAAVPLFYWLARKLLPERVAILGALFMAFDPFYLAHSRVAHGDAPVAVFMSLSALTFFIYLNRSAENREASGPKPSLKRLIVRTSFSPYLLASAILGSLAALTKAPGQFMALFVIGMSALYVVLDLRSVKRQPARFKMASGNPSHFTFDVSGIITHWLIVIAVWGFVSLAVFILLWPSMWVDPLGTFRQIWDETFSKVNEGHLVYFFGQPTLDPGRWFYLYVIPFRLTPVILFGGLLSLFCFIPPLNSLFGSTGCGARNTRATHWALRPVFLLWLFTIALLLFGNLSSKKQDRYLLPLFPFLNLIAAMGWLSFFDLSYHFLKSYLPHAQLSARSVQPGQRQARAGQTSPISQRFDLALRQARETSQNKSHHLPITTYQFLTTALLTLSLLLIHLTPTLTYYPYYLTYFNPLMGGPTRAAETTLMGWGEGMEQVAAYLNAKPEAAELYVASTPSQTLLPYFAGTGENFYTNDIAFRADYVVLYLAQMQRLAPSPEIVRYFETKTPEKIITIHGVPYAKIYPGPKLILSDMPPEATPVNIGLEDTIRLAGYQISKLPSLRTGPSSRFASGNLSGQAAQSSDFVFGQAQGVSQDKSPHLEAVGQTSPIIADQLPITLYWHALAPLTTDYTISVRLHTADGRRLAQQDSWPVKGLLPTSQWRQGDYVVDTHTLAIAAEDWAGAGSLEIVVYNASTGQTLGPPITLPIVETEGQ